MEKIKVHDKTFKLYMTESEICAAVQRVADEISHDYVNRSPILCPVLTGSYMFAADLSRCMTIDAPISFVRYSSYEGMASTGQVKKSLGFSKDCRGRDVIVVEDIIDSGLSMQHLLPELRQLEPASIAFCTFLFKPGNFRGDYKVDYIGRSIPNDFIVGYGMDYDGLGRTYRDIYVIDE